MALVISVLSPFTTIDPVRPNSPAWYDPRNGNIPKMFTTGAAIRAHRRRLNLVQVRVAKEAGCSQQAIVAIEHAERVNTDARVVHSVLDVFDRTEQAIRETAATMAREDLPLEDRIDLIARKYDQILMEYLGRPVGAFTLRGYASGKSYRFGADPPHVRRWVATQDAPPMLALLERTPDGWNHTFRVAPEP